ncbi:MAG TPA: hypothetical protein DE060_10730 [Lentisphaeria bacterium]|nr:hypothetical protein [Lentisphaeria bacterium]HCG49660.1 hypothetical protein [Lentisphaeria bacterium]
MFRLPLFSKRQTKRSENACSRSLLRSYFPKKASKKLEKEGKAAIIFSFLQRLPFSCLQKLPELLRS